MNFEEICRDYFPRWYNAKSWQLQDGRRGQWVDAQGEIRYTPENGYCDGAQRVIWVSDSSTATLIHEICHAVTGPYHGKRFLARLRQAAQHAERLGETALALALSQDADRHEVKVRRTPATFFYNRVEDIVIEAPSLTFEQIVDSLAADEGITPPELHRRAQRLRRVYEKAQQEWS